jgi:hypothetical protein
MRNEPNDHGSGRANEKPDEQRAWWVAVLPITVCLGLGVVVFLVRLLSWDRPSRSRTPTARAIDKRAAREQEGSRPAIMQARLIRNATVRLEYGGSSILLDPSLDPAGA